MSLENFIRNAPRGKIRCSAGTASCAYDIKSETPRKALFQLSVAPK